MKLDLEFVELHAPLFINGTNFGLKLYADPKKNKGPVTLWYDTDLRHTFVIFKDKVAMIENTASMTLSNPEQVGLALSSHPVLNQLAAQPLPNTTVKAQVSGPGVGMHHTAQVSTPMDKVQGGKKKIAKYQGEESQGE